MNNTRPFLFAALFFLGFALYQNWQQDYGTSSSGSNNQSQPSSVKENKDLSVPQVGDAPQVGQEPEYTKKELPRNSDFSGEEGGQSPTHLVEVNNGVLTLRIDTRGAGIKYAELLHYPATKGATENVVLMDDSEKNRYYAQGGLVSSSPAADHRQLFKTSADKVDATKKAVEIPFVWEKDGIKVTKTYHIEPDSYVIKVHQTVENHSGQPWTGYAYQQLQRNNPWEGKKSGFTDPARMSLKGAAFYDADEGYTKVPFTDMKDFLEEGEKPVEAVVNKGWIAMVQHYFLSSFIDDKEPLKVQTRYLPDSPTPYLIRFLTPAKTIESGQSHDFEATLFIGPKLQKLLPTVAQGLELTVDYGIFTVIAKPLFAVLSFIYSFVLNWGWSIVILTILIKLAFFKLTESQYKSMARMRKLQPRIQTLKERYKGNRQRFNEEMMKLYQKEKVNPLGGCLPMLVQIPVFIALYWVLLESVELRQAPFILWLQDLSSPDPYYILPAINAAAMYMTQRLSPTPGMDPMQQKIMKFMPLAFSFMFAFFQSGLVLYWAVNSSLSLLQQWIITKRVEKQPY